MATLGSKPISSGAKMVEPNMATTCCAPMAIFCVQGKHSSGCTTEPGAEPSTRRQRGKKESDIEGESEVENASPGVTADAIHRSESDAKCKVSAHTLQHIFAF